MALEQQLFPTDDTASFEIKNQWCVSLCVCVFLGFLFTVPW